MKNFTIALILIISCGLLHAGVIERQYTFRNLSLEPNGNYTLLKFDNTRQFGEPGKAILPFFAVSLLIPPGEIAESAEFIGSDMVTIKGSYQLSPAQSVRPVSEGQSGEFLKDRKFYRSSQVYPAKSMGNVTTQYMNGYGFAFVTFTPVQYIPSKGQISYYTTVTIRIRTKPDIKAQAALKNLNSKKSCIEKVKALAQNPEMTGEYPLQAIRADDYESLIITGAGYTASFDTLASFYKRRGIRSLIVSTDYIGSMIDGQDLQEKIRNYIIQEYQAHSIQYVLLGGDVEIVPFRGFYCFVYSGPPPYYESYNIPSDLYYSGLDGNWNTNGDNKWAEPREDDLLPEVAVGRLTFSDNAELHRMLQKSMSYQQDPVTGELTHPLMAGEYLNPAPELTYGEDYMRLLIGYRTDNGYTTQGIPVDHDIDSLYDSHQTWYAADLLAKINQGTSFIHHCGHASDGYVMRLYNSDITNANFSQVDGIIHNYTLVYTHGCNCGAFDDADCIAEKMIGIDNFAVAFFGNSRFGWFNQGTTDGPSEHLHREFVDALYRDSLYRAGDAHLRSKLETAPWVVVDEEFEPGATRWCFYDNHLLGDPMLAIWTYEPSTVSADFISTVPIGVDSMIVNVLSNGVAPKGFTCTLMQGDSVFGVAQTDSLGSAVIKTIGNVMEGQADLYITGNNSLVHQYEVVVADYWLGYSDDWNDSANWFTGSVPDSTTNIYIPEHPVGLSFPASNKGPAMNCKTVFMEPRAHFIIERGETITIHGN